MNVKFKNLKTGEILTPDEAFNKFCGTQDCCAECPLDSLPGTWEDCEAWMRDNIEKTAKIAGLEVVKEGEKMKPKICEILGVEVGEEFKINGWDEVVFQILDDGTFSTEPVNVPGSSTALLRALDHPEWVEHLPSWSPDEVTLARVFLDACYDKESVFFARKGNGRLCWGVDSEGMDLSENHLPVCLFPRIKNDQKVYLRDIVGEGGGEKDEI